MKNIGWLVLRCLMWAALSAVLFLVCCQERLAYFPSKYDAAALQDLVQGGGRRIEVMTSQGRQTAFYLPSPKLPAQSPEFLWLVCGGNGALALDYLTAAESWDGRAGFLFVDYPGYGLCEGHPNPASIEESIVASVKALQAELHWSDAELQSRTGVFGHSLGCAAALIAADRLQFRRAILCAPFTTMTDMARHTVGWPLCYLNRHRFDNIARLRALSARGAQVRIFHATGDEVVPVAMSRKLAAMFPQIVCFTEVADSHHNEIVDDAAESIGRAVRELAGGASR